MYESPRGWTWQIYRQGSAENFLGFEFRESIFFWVLVRAAVFLGLLNKRCILKCLIFSTVFFWVQFHSPGASVIMGLHYYHIMLDFCEMNSVFESIF